MKQRSDAAKNFTPSETITAVDVMYDSELGLTILEYRMNKIRDAF
jgi:hypothetical protein